MTFAGPPAFVLATLVLAASPLLGVSLALGAVAGSAAFLAIALFGHARPLDWRLRLLLPFALVDGN